MKSNPKNNLHLLICMLLPSCKIKRHKTAHLRPPRRQLPLLGQTQEGDVYPKVGRHYACSWTNYLFCNYFLMHLVIFCVYADAAIHGPLIRRHTYIPVSLFLTGICQGININPCRVPSYGSRARAVAAAILSFILLAGLILPYQAVSFTME